MMKQTRWMWRAVRCSRNVETVEKALAFEVCPRTCGCVDQISNRSCHILKATDHCDEKNIASACRDTCGVCGRKPTGKLDIVL